MDRTGSEAGARLLHCFLAHDCDFFANYRELLSRQLSSGRSEVAHFLSGNLFRYLLFPVVSALLGIGIKFVTRNDRYRAFTKEDMAIGLDLMLTAFLLYLALASDESLALAAVHHDMAASGIAQDSLKKLQGRADDITNFLTSSGWIITALLVGLWSVSTLIRKWGWQSETELRPMWGIGLPIVIGVLFLLFVMNEAVGP